MTAGSEGVVGTVRVGVSWDGTTGTNPAAIVVSIGSGRFAGVEEPSTVSFTGDGLGVSVVVTGLVGGLAALEACCSPFSMSKALEGPMHGNST